MRRVICNSTETHQACPSFPTETIKWLWSLPILMQESFWWWQCSDRYIISLFPHLHIPFSPLLPVPMVSVDVKHHVYLLCIASWLHHISLIVLLSFPSAERSVLVCSHEITHFFRRRSSLHFQENKRARSILNKFMSPGGCSWIFLSQC